MIGKRIAGAVVALSLTAGLCPAAAFAAQANNVQTTLTTSAQMSAQSHLWDSTDLDDGYFIYFDGVPQYDFDRYIVEPGRAVAPNIEVRYSSDDLDSDINDAILDPDVYTVEFLSFNEDSLERDVPVSLPLPTSEYFYKVVVKAKEGSGYTGSTYAYISVNDNRDLNAAEISLDAKYQDDSSSYGYAVPQGDHPEYQVTIDGVAVPASSYSITYWNTATLEDCASFPVTPGKYGSFVEGKGAYHGDTSFFFEVTSTGARIPVSTATISGLSEEVYTGAAIKPAISVIQDGITLKAGTDYQVSYANNINVGTATVTIAGKGSYTGSKSATFKIARANLSSAVVSGLIGKTYTGKSLTQNPVVKVNGRTLKAGTDYTVIYGNNVNAGNALVTITGKGLYTGSKYAVFNIAKAKQPMAVKAKNKTAKAKTVKKKAVTLKGAVTVSKAQGAVTYKNVSTQKKAKKFKVNAKTGAITVPKKTKKGTYKVKVAVSAAGNANYLSGSKTATVKVVVK